MPCQAVSSQPNAFSSSPTHGGGRVTEEVAREAIGLVVREVTGASSVTDRLPYNRTADVIRVDVADGPLRRGDEEFEVARRGYASGFSIATPSTA